MSISSENKIIAKSALQAFGGSPKVNKYWDDQHKSSIDILSASDRPYEGVSSYSTLNLSDYSIDLLIDEKPLTIEIVGACYTEFNLFSNVLSTCAFNIINSNYSCAPGVIFRDVLKMYYPNTEMEHILFAPPFLWEESLKTIEFSNKCVTWLLAVPISEKEYHYAEEHGPENLEKLFEHEKIDIFNIERKSVL
ncbi:suppressor of fused domain protein [Pseudalkalibacillus decolorationis]|uniref:suppressor of fused domain protein n=1 Tax=Pseudalkalibacillus decolorationis TaxID=163879 RepID=UPI002148DEE0|nr:suppressor of fused domain protein [Pseudalkalibacillus decolorationis]